MAFNWREVPDKFEECLETRKQVDLFRQLRAGKGWKTIAADQRISERNVGSMVARIKERVIKAGYNPESNFDRMTLPPHFVKARSELVKISPDGKEEVVMYWNKTDTVKRSFEESLRLFIEGMKDEIAPAKPEKLEKGKKFNSELLSAIIIGDAHVGAYCYAPETRHLDFDTDIATRDLRAAIDDLVTRAPDSETGMLVNVGDFLHANTSHNTTFKGTPVDVDTRHPRVMRAAGMALRYGIDRMLQKFRHVSVVMGRGNHDPDAAVSLQLMLEFYYEKEPRVTILPTQSSFHYVEFGKWLFGINHGDKIKPQKLVGVMARDMAEAWGRTTHRMWFLGHVHHEKVIELDGCKVKTFGTLAARDGWHSSMGYGSESTMEMITFKKSGGTHSSLVYDIPAPRVEPDLRIV